jgi:hypothetical protein
VIRNRIDRLALAVLAVAGLTVASVFLTPVTAGATGVRHRVELVGGTFIGQPLTVTNVAPTDDPNVYSFDGASGDQWAGALTGSTSYSGSGTINLATGETRMVLHETFTGTIKGFGSGQLRFVEYLQSGPDNLGQVDCLVVGGTGDLARVRGALEFRATSVVDPDPTGNGTSYGPYTGFLFQ